MPGMRPEFVRQRVVFVRPNAGWPHHQELAAHHLIPGKEYTVVWKNVGQSSTQVKLEEVIGVEFNSVHFDTLPAGSPPLERFPDDPR